MKLKATRTIWLSNPVTALSLNLENGQAFAEQVILSDPTAVDMTTYGWLSLGTAEVVMTIDKLPDQIAREAVQALQTKLVEKDAEHQKLRNTFLDAIGKFQALTYTPGR